MSLTNKIKPGWKLGIIILLVLVLLPAGIAHAAESKCGGIWNSLDLDCIIEGSVTYFLAKVLIPIFANITAFLIYVLNISVYARAGTDVQVVRTIWEVLRNIANMFFILALIWMAFATIFNVGKYRFQDMIWRFLIVAILINFSLVLGGLIIDASQVLVNVFLKSIGNPGDKIGQFISPATLLPKEVSSGTTALVSLVFALVLNGIFIFSLLVADLFALFRIVAIWGLLAVAPIAWMAYILPGTHKWWGKWWGLFFGWNLFLPVYLFILYIGLVFLSQGRTVVQSIVGSNSSSFFSSLSLNTLVLFGAASMFLAYGTVMAAKLTVAFGGGDGFQKGLNWATTFARRSPGFSSYFAAQKAAGEKVSQYKKEGVPGFKWVYGGEEAQKKLEQRWRERLRVGGAGKQFLKDAGEKFESTEDEYDTGKISFTELQQRVQSTKATTPEGFAYRKLAIKKGVLDEKQFVDALASAQNNPLAIRELIKTADEAKYAGIDKKLKDIVFDPKLQGAEFISARRQILASIGEDAKKASGFKYDDIEKAVGVLGGISTGLDGKNRLSPEANKFIGGMAKVNPDLVFEYRQRNNLLEPVKAPEPLKDESGNVIYDDQGQPKYPAYSREPIRTKATAIRDSLNVKAEDVAKIPERLWVSEEFQAALKDKVMNPAVSYDSRRNFRNNLERQLLETGEYAKIEVLEKVAPKELFKRRDDQQRRRTSNQGQQNPPNQNPPGGQAGGEQGGPILYGPDGRPIGGGASYGHLQGINQANVIDLRNKKDYEIK